MIRSLLPITQFMLFCTILFAFSEGKSRHSCKLVSDIEAAKFFDLQTSLVKNCRIKQYADLFAPELKVYVFGRVTTERR